MTTDRIRVRELAPGERFSTCISNWTLLEHDAAAGVVWARRHDPDQPPMHGMRDRFAPTVLVRRGWRGE
jgi:hypothetical protein